MVVVNAVDRRKSAPESRTSRYEYWVKVVISSLHRLSARRALIWFPGVLKFWDIFVKVILLSLCKFCRYDIIVCFTCDDPYNKYFSFSVWFYFCIFLHMVQNKLLFTTNKQNNIGKIEKWYIFCDICCKNMHERLNYIIMSDVVESLFTQLIIPNMKLFWLVSYLTKTPKFLLWLLVIDIFKMTISLACIPPVELILFDFFSFISFFLIPVPFRFSMIISVHWAVKHLL